MKLEKFLLRYSPPGIGLAYIQSGQRKEKMIDLFDLSPKTNIEELSEKICQLEPLISGSAKPKLNSLLTKLQERLQKELGFHYVCHQTLDQHNLPIAGVALSKDGTKCITGSFDNTCKVWDIANGSLNFTISSHTAPVYSVAFNHPYGDLIITGSFDKSVCLTNAENGQPLKSLWGHTDEIVVVQYDPNDNVIGTASMDKTAKIYCVERGEELWTIVGHEEALVSLNFSYDGRNVLTASFDTDIHLWDMRTHRKVASFKEHSEEVSSCLFNFNSTLIGSGSVDKTAKIWDLRSDESITTVFHNDEVLDVNFDCAGRKFASAGLDGLIHVSDVLHGEAQKILLLPGHSKEVSKLSFSPGGGLLLSGSADGTCRLWHIEIGECKQILFHPEDVYACLFSYDGSIIASAGNDSVCRLWKENSLNQGEISESNDH